MALGWQYAEFGAGQMNMPEALGIVVTGLVVVFLVLVLLVVIFSLMGKSFAPKGEKKEKAPKEIKKEVKKEDIKPSVVKNSPDNSLIAVITAALHEYIGGGFVIKKIRPARVGKKTVGAWGKNGRSQNTRPF